MMKLLRPARTPEEGMRRAVHLMRMAKLVFLLNLFALSATLTLIALLRFG